LNWHLSLRPSEAAQSRVIAVDGFDTRAVQKIINKLHESIKQQANLTIRVFEPLAYKFGHEPRWFEYTRYIEQWNLLWEFLISTPFPPITSDAYGSLDQKTRPQSAFFCVNIVPYSPLMVTLKAGTTIRTDDEIETWRGLARKWQGQIQPDITISVLENTYGPDELGVSRFSSHHTIALEVSKAPWAADAINGITPGQLRRICFEVLECLVDG